MMTRAMCGDVFAFHDVIYTHPTDPTHGDVRSHKHDGPPIPLKSTAHPSRIPSQFFLTLFLGMTAAAETGVKNTVMEDVEGRGGGGRYAANVCALCFARMAYYTRAPNGKKRV
jgi:hypothetical protein